MVCAQHKKMYTLHQLDDWNKALLGYRINWISKGNITPQKGKIPSFKFIKLFWSNRCIQYITSCHLYLYNIYTIPEWLLVIFVRLLACNKKYHHPRPLNCAFDNSNIVDITYWWHGAISLWNIGVNDLIHRQLRGTTIGNDHISH